MRSADAGFNGGTLPPAIAADFATAMSQALLLPPAVVVIAIVAACFLRRPAARADTAEAPLAAEVTAG